jgi:hypothetical protein
VTPIGTGKWRTQDWVRDELNYARTKLKPAIALVDVVIDTGGMNQDRESIEYHPQNESLALSHRRCRDTGQGCASSGSRWTIIA